MFESVDSVVNDGLRNLDRYPLLMFFMPVQAVLCFKEMFHKRIRDLYSLHVGRWKSG